MTGGRREGTVKLTQISSSYPQDPGHELVLNPTCWASETAVSLNLTVPRGEAQPDQSIRAHLTTCDARPTSMPVADGTVVSEPVLQKHALCRKHKQEEEESCPTLLRPCGRL